MITMVYLPWPALKRVKRSDAKGILASRCLQNQEKSDVPGAGIAGGEWLRCEGIKKLDVLGGAQR